MSFVRLPNLYCPFPSDVNPHSERVNEMTIAWAQRWQLASHPTIYQHLQKLKLGQLAGRTHPSAAVDGLQLIADWCTWLFLHDDFCDEASLSHDPSGLQHWHDDLTIIMDSRSPAAAPTSGLVAGFANLWQRSIAAAPPGWAARFCKNLSQFFAAAVWEARNRAHQHLPSLDDYVHWRPLTSGMYMYIDLIEVANQISLPAHVLQHPLLQQLRTVTARGACWVNDILSFEKEARRGDTHNLVLVLAATQRLSIEEALAQAAAIHDHDVHTFLELEQQLLSAGMLYDSEVRRYVSVLRAYLRGNLDWTSQSMRYQGAGSTYVVHQRVIG